MEDLCLFYWKPIPLALSIPEKHWSHPLPHFKPPVRWHWEPPGTFCNGFTFRDILWFSPGTPAAASGIINSCAIIIFHFRRVVSNIVFLAFLSSLAAFGAPCISSQSLIFVLHSWISMSLPIKSPFTYFAKRPLSRKKMWRLVLKLVRTWREQVRVWAQNRHGPGEYGIALLISHWDFLPQLF